MAQINCPGLKETKEMFAIPSLLVRNRLVQLFFSLCLLAGSVITAQAATFPVTTVADNGDNVNPTAGSLRAAIIDANNTIGADTITFSIGSGPQTITPASALPSITDPLIIDGTTQPGFAGAPIIEISGASAGANVTGLSIVAGDCVVKGLVINRFAGSYGIEVGGTGNNIISGNYIGTDMAGTAEKGNFVGIGIHSPNNTIGGTTAADRNIVSGNNSNSGVAIGGQFATGNLIVGNYIGTDVTGTIAIGNGVGVYVIQATSNNIIGGTTAGARNLISGNGTGIGLSSSGNKIWGNYIGTKADGTSGLPNYFAGLEFFDGQDNFIGGSSPGQGNVIAFNGVNGTGFGIAVRAGSSTSRNAILGNSIHSNGGLGIDLAKDGVTPNDAGDVDTGSLTANEFQNYPVLTSATPNGNNLDIKGDFNSLPNTQFRLEFFSNTTADASGAGEGRTFLGAMNVTTDGGGNAPTFTFSVPSASVVGNFVTATATDPNNNTSEFSNWRATPGNGPGVIEINEVSYTFSEGVGSTFILVKRTSGSTGVVSVNYATSDGIGPNKATAPADYTSKNSTLTLIDGQTADVIAIPIFDDSLVENKESFFVTLSNPTNGATLGAQTSSEIFITDNDVAPVPKIQFSTTNYSAGEASGQATITVTRTGDTSGGATVDYRTTDTDTFTVGCADKVNNNGSAYGRCDFAAVVGTLSFAAGEGSKTFFVPVIDDSYDETDESLSVVLSNPTGGAALGSPSKANVTITDNEAVDGPNPILSSNSAGVAFFVRQQYLDFLGREPDGTGFQNWVNTLTPCPNGGFGEPPTSDCDRLHVAKGFFQSDEFLNRGYWAFRFYMVSYNQRPTYAQFMPDMAKVGGPKSPAEEEASKIAFADAYVQRPEFLAKYNGLSGQALANALLQTAGLPSGTFTVNGNMTNGQVLRGIVETSAVLNKFLTEGTVSIQYFAFLRRNPDAVGYQNNVNTLNADPNNLRHMIFIFIYSTEYRSRFGPE
jgi:hypothetical protein